jgi:hypothetical protein
VRAMLIIGSDVMRIREKTGVLTRPHVKGSCERGKRCERKTVPAAPKRHGEIDVSGLPPPKAVMNVATAGYLRW